MQKMEFPVIAGNGHPVAINLHNKHYHYMDNTTSRDNETMTMKSLLGLS